MLCAPDTTSLHRCGPSDAEVGFPAAAATCAGCDRYRRNEPGPDRVRRERVTRPMAQIRAAVEFIAVPKSACGLARDLSARPLEPTLSPGRFSRAAFSLPFRSYPRSLSRFVPIRVPSPVSFLSALRRHSRVRLHDDTQTRARVVCRFTSARTRRGVSARVQLRDRREKNETKKTRVAYSIRSLTPPPPPPGYRTRTANENSRLKPRVAPAAAGSRPDRFRRGFRTA